jgi:hypothetical protein
VSRPPDKTGFAPSDLTDSRNQWQWESRYPRKAKIQIGIEAVYLLLLLLGIGLSLYVTWQGQLGGWLSQEPTQQKTFSLYAYAWLGGLLGGLLFAMKWLYHTVAHGWWNADRLLWRLFAPLISAALALAFLSLLYGQVLFIVDQDVIRAGPATFGTAFLVGYFSDPAVAALARRASRLFGDNLGFKSKAPPQSQDSSRTSQSDETSTEI